MPTIQHELFSDHTFHDSAGKIKRAPVWYYVHDLVTDKMLVLEESGAWNWLPNDTINSTPHLFSNLQLAISQIGRLGHGTPKTYPWKQ